MRKPKLWEWIASAAIVFVLVTIIFPISACACGSPTTVCVSKLKQLFRATEIYLADYDQRLPIRDRWMDDLDPYLSGSSQFRDPEITNDQQYGYAFDSRLSTRNKALIADPSTQALAYDSINLGRNASDPFVSLPIPGRHKGVNSVVYMDGRAKRAKP